MIKRNTSRIVCLSAATAVLVNCTSADLTALDTGSSEAIQTENTVMQSAQKSSEPAKIETKEFRSFAAPNTISEEAKAYIDKGGNFELATMVPETYEDWKALQVQMNAAVGPFISTFASMKKLDLTEDSIASIPVYFAIPEQVAPEKANKIILSLHGGGYVVGGEEASAIEGLIVTAASGFPSVSIDYRMPPDHPFPAALQDTTKVYRELLKSYEPEDIAFIGSSAGGGLAAASILHIRDLGLPLPSAVVLNTPWSDLDKIGDTYTTLEGLDPVLVTYDGLLGAMAELYTKGEDMQNPLLSPVYGDFEPGFPPSLLISGTRDLFLSNTVRLHRALRGAGASSDLHVFEGMWHGFNTVPESEGYKMEVRLFLERALLAHSEP